MIKSVAKIAKSAQLLKKELGFDNVNACPKIEKVVVNVGVGSVTDKQTRDGISALITKITGQKAAYTKAKKSVAAFKIRQGNTVGFKTTLRGKRKYDFLDKLINVVLPRTRDFRGIKLSSLQQRVFNIGIRDVGIFPEIKPDELKSPVGIEITVVLSTNKQADQYLRLLGFPLEKVES